MTVVPFVEMTSFPYQATATSHPNGLRPQQDHPDSGRHHLSPPKREYLSKGGRDRELFSPVYLWSPAWVSSHHSPPKGSLVSALPLSQV